MTILITCRYRDGGADARLAIRDVHLEYIVAHRSEIRYAGALASDDDRDAVGMLIAHEADDFEVAEAFMAEEPYRRNGLFAEVTYARLRQFIPHPETPDFLQQELARERQRLGADRPSRPDDAERVTDP